MILVGWTARLIAICKPAIRRRQMKLAPKILIGSLLAATSFCLAGSVHAVPIGMGLGMNDAVAPTAETVRLGGAGGRGGAGRAGGAGRVGGVGGPGRVGGIGGPGRPGNIGGPGRPGNIGGPGYGWNGGYRPGYGF